MRNLTEDEMTIVYGGGFNYHALSGDNCSKCGTYIGIGVICAIAAAAIAAAATAAAGGPAAPAGAVAGAAVGEKLCDYLGGVALSAALPYCVACAKEVFE